MLKELRIFNIILIEKAEITFEKGLNVITGETGSGKSAVMHALGFIIGARSDSTLIRKGCEKGAVEAAFEIEKQARIKDILAAAGIDHELGSDLIIRREIASNGKSRAYINNQMVQVALLKNIGEALLGIVGQHANQHLLSTSHHRHIINIFGNLEADTSQFAGSWSRENELKQQLLELTSNEAKRLREIEVCVNELKELDEANIKEGEDEELFTEYSLLTNSEEIAQKLDLLISGLSGEKQSIIPALKRQKKLLDDLAAIDPTLTETAKSCTNALLELEEITHTITAYQGRVEYNPEKIRELDERLALINALKRKYGATIDEIRAYRKSSAAKLDQLENADTVIEDLTIQIKELEARNDTLANALTAQRKTAAAKFQTAIIKQLRSLNMPKVEFQVEITPQKRDRSGNDSMEFFLLPNIGEHRIPLKGCASGGELSRLLLALHTVLAGKENTPTLIFDEIDANIGGETASVVGAKLKEIERKQQVICITHFPQVARLASQHLQISKKEKLGRTITTVKVVSDSSRQEELKRMLGGNLEDSLAYIS